MKNVFLIIFRITLVVVALLAAWGFDDVGGFFEHPARLGLVLALGAAGVVGLVWFRHIAALPKGEKTVGVGLMFVWIVFGTLMALWFPYADRRGFLVIPRVYAAWLRYLGLLLFLAGMTMRLASLASLGKQFSGHVTIQAGHKLVRTGMYNFVRHPMYLGLLALLAGLPLLFRSWLTPMALLFTLAFVFVRIRMEEKLLAEQFGAEFEEYRKRTWRLVPYLY